MAIDLKDIVQYLNDVLNIDGFKDSAVAMNGLQVENNGVVTKVSVAVDGSESAIKEAIKQKADLLILHHGIFWQTMQPITGIAYRKLKLAMDHNLAIYSAHLPLDQHPKYGNNAILSRLCGLEPTLPSFSYHGNELGCRGVLEISGRELLARLEKATGKPFHAFWNHDPEQSAGDTLICSGGAGDDISAVAALGCKTYVTGEGSHWNIPIAQELGINLLLGGHYETETFGVKSLGKLLQEKFQLPYEFLDLPPHAYSLAQ